MSMTRLQEDLLNDFKEQKRMVVEQIELFDPLGKALVKPAARKLADPMLMAVLEVLSYLFAAGNLALTVGMNRIYPFSTLQNVRYLRSAADARALTEAEHFSIVVHTLAGLTAFLFLAIGLLVRRIRLKNRALKIAGSATRSLLSQHLQRRATIETLEHRHFLDLPSFGGVVSAALATDSAHNSASPKQ